MADIVKRRTDRGDGNQSAQLEPLRTVFATLPALFGDNPLREFERVLRLEQDLAFVPRFDVKETKDAYILRADLPGIPEENVEISVVGNRLTVSGQREREADQQGDAYLASERCYGAFARSFILPDAADAGNIKAEMKDGVLTITLPKRPEAQPRKITLGKQQGAQS
jgi:HSP20 family protein